MTQVTDQAGNVYNLIPAAEQAAQAVNSTLGGSQSTSNTISKVGSVLSAVSGYLAQRTGESSTTVATGATIAAAPQLLESATNAFASFATGNIVGGITQLLPILGILATVLIPEKGVTNDQITTAVSSLTRDQLIGLLNTGATNASPVTATVTGVGSIVNTAAVSAVAANAIGSGT